MIGYKKESNPSTPPSTKQLSAVMSSSNLMASFSSNEESSNGSPSRPQDEGSTGRTMTRRSPRNTADYDLVSGLSSIHTVPKLGLTPPSPSASRQSFSSPFQKRRRKSSSYNPQHLLTLQKCFFLGWFLCFGIGYLIFNYWQSGGTRIILLGGSDISASDHTPTPEHYVRSRSPKAMAPIGKLKAEPSEQTEASKRVTKEDEESASGSEVEAEEPSLVHIIHSRFMQHQPALVELGLARLELMKAFFLPSLSSQSSQNFLCVVRIDPDLNATLKDALLEAMEAAEGDFEYLVIASNENPHSEYLDIIKHSDNVESTPIVGGNYTAAKEYITRYRNIIETRLDVDDGLNQYFVEELQDQAVDHFDAYVETKGNSPWKVWCASTHFQWQFQPSEMWEAKEENPQTALPNVTGSLLSIRSTICITAGLSIAYVAPKSDSADEQMIDMPSTQKHTSIHRDLLHCGTKKAKKLHKSGGCFDWFNLMPTAIRARSPTSAGMYNILWPHRNHKDSMDDARKLQNRYLKEARRQETNQAKFWNASDYFFDFGESSASHVHAYLSDHMKEIVQENLVGQCTHGHSCKNSSRLQLESILKDY